jgi:hypothetical protein
MKIRMKELYAAPGAVYERGKEYELDVTLASTLVRLDLADQVDGVEEGAELDLDTIDAAADTDTYGAQEDQDASGPIDSAVPDESEPEEKPKAPRKGR